MNEAASFFNKEFSLFTAKINGFTPEDELIFKFNYNPNLIDGQKDENGNYALFLVCKYDIYNTLAIMILEEDPNAILQTDWTEHRNPLNVVIDENRLDLMPLVLENSISFINNYNGRPSYTPLQYIINKEQSTTYDKYAFMKLILDNSHLLVNATNKIGETALYRACRTHDVKAIQFLLERTDIDLSICPLGDVPAFYRLFLKSDQYQLSSAFDDIEMIDYTNHAEYNDAMENDSLLIIIKIFMNHFPNILDDIYKSDNSILHFAIIHDCHRVIPFIVNNMTLSINCVNAHQHTPLYVACGNDKNYKVTKFLLNITDISINVKDEMGMTPLHNACNSKSVKNVNYLLNYPGVDTFPIDFRGNTLLHHAINDDHIHWSSIDHLPNFEMQTLIELLLGTDQKIGMNLKILKKNDLGFTVFGQCGYMLHCTKHDLNSPVNPNYVDNHVKILKVQFWKDNLTILHLALSKGRYDFYEYLMDSW